MSDVPEQQQPQQQQQPVKPVPTARVEKSTWPFPLVWLVPVAAAVLAGWFFYQRHQERGVEIVIRFTDGSGLKPSETTVDVSGVTVGHVRAIDLADDHKTVLVHVQLETRNAFLAKANTKFWVVRPEVSLSNISGLNTIVSGPYIDAKPGDGAQTVQFTGLEAAPKFDPPGLHLLLYADQAQHVTDDSPVTFRGIQVGAVRDVRLGDDSARAGIDIVIYDRYRYLVRSKSVFWVDKGADLKGSLFGGVKLNLGSVQSLLVGSIAFGTPEKDSGTVVSDGAQFELFDQPKDEWLHWHAVIMPKPDSPNPPTQHDTGSGSSLLPQLKHE
jgi:paraquat-inducible protein B